MGGGALCLGVGRGWLGGLGDGGARYAAVRHVGRDGIIHRSLDPLRLKLVWKTRGGVTLKVGLLYHSHSLTPISSLGGVPGVYTSRRGMASVWVCPYGRWNCVVAVPGVEGLGVERTMPFHRNECSSVTTS